MGILDNYYMNRYNIVTKKIENLNSENQKGYKLFSDYVLADRKMKIYFEELKSMEKRCKKIKVESKEIFNNSVQRQLTDIYEKRILDIFEIDKDEDKKSKLNEFKEELNQSIGYGFDQIIKKLILDIDEKIHNINRYIVIDSKHHFSTDTGRGVFEEKILNEIFNYRNETEITKEIYVDSEELLKKAVDLMLECDYISISFIQRKLKLGYKKAEWTINQLEEMGLIAYNLSEKKIKILITYEEWNKMKKNGISKFENINSKSILKVPTEITDEKVLKKLTDEEYTDYKRKQEIDKMSDEEFLKMHGIDTEYNSGIDSFKSICNSLIIESISEDDKIKFINSILRYNEPQKLKLILITKNFFDFEFYNDLPNMLLPIMFIDDGINKTLKWLLKEITTRLGIFWGQKTKDFYSYNEKTDVEQLPAIVLVIDEIYDILKKDDNKDTILRILLNCERVGIKCIFYSKFSKKNLNIGSMEDLIHIYTKYSPNILECKNKKNSSIVNIDYDMNGFDFEKYAGELLQKNGFEKVEITQRSGDFGVDIIAYKDDIKYAIQCKKYSSTVGIKAVQEVIASKAMNNCHVAVVLTNNYFTKSAKELAEKNNVLLWDREKLLNLIKQVSNLN